MIFRNSKLLLTIFSLVSLALLAVLILSVYSIRIKNRETSELLNLIDNAAEMEMLTRSIKAIQYDAREDIKAFGDFVLSSDKLVPLIESIEGAGRTLGLDTKIISVGKIEDKKLIESDMIRIVMETQGPWAPTLSFLRAVESLPNRVMIEESSFSRGETVWRSKIVLSLYSFD